MANKKQAKKFVWNDSDLQVISTGEKEKSFNKSKKSDRIKITYRG